ncbi:hypothetical protein [Pseudosporangium ferrugineum]|uniref:Cytochrome P450 n=1 Tax=Pseudosporangium ferrugineum TaxID=439699 RepID=A0A2T0RNY4_9ACTN|nr:hypothetical protein [Pseudosporangium ferrugineum]PRY22904.1 hypothetical protein CLV70_116167 [Pseudosporangium ferrugineum]
MIDTAVVTSVLARSFDFVPDRSAGAVTEGLSFSMVPKGFHLTVTRRA